MSCSQFFSSYPFTNRNKHHFQIQVQVPPKHVLVLNRCCFPSHHSSMTVWAAVFYSHPNSNSRSPPNIRALDGRVNSHFLLNYAIKNWRVFLFLIFILYPKSTQILRHSWILLFLLFCQLCLCQRRCFVTDFYLNAKFPPNYNSFA